MTMKLIDDGTLDTVFCCSECEEEARYSQEWRAEYLLHDEDCPAVEAGEYPDERDAACTCSPDLDTEGAEAAAEEDHECVNADPAEPEPGDYILSPAGPLGVHTAVSVVEGGYLGTFDRNGGRYDSSEDWALAVVRERMAAESYYPNVWRQDDHGGYVLLTVEG